jgi:hypothetical protein
MVVPIAGLFVAFSLLLSGCAISPPEGSEAWKEAQRAVLTERAEARWAALIKRDIEKAYAYTSPEYRNVVSLQQYGGKYGRVVNWRMARVVKVSYDGPAVATVTVDVTYRTGILGSGGEAIETRRPIPEKWIYKDREWWFASN